MRTHRRRSDMIPAMTSTRRRWLIVALVAGVLIFSGSRLRESLGIDLDVESVRTFAEGLGPMGPLLFVGVVALRSLLALPSQVVLIAAGLCFGTLVGTFVGGAGLMLSGLGLFFAARYTGRHEIERRFGTRFSELLQASGQRAGAVALAVGTGYPVSPLSPIHAAAGLTPMSIGLFIVAAFVGGATRASVFAFFGSALSESSLSGLLYPTLALAIALATPLAFPSGRMWLRRVFLGPEVRPEIQAGVQAEVRREDHRIGD